VSEDEGPWWPRATGVELVQDVSKLSSPVEGYLRRYRHRIKTLFDDGTRSEVYVADYMDRDPSRRDAVAIAVYARAKSGRVEDTIVLLRSQVRYAAYVRAKRPLVTEVIAGLIEHDEPPETTAVRELWEEAGLEVDHSAVKRLGRSFFILPGIFTERVVPLAVEVRADALAAALEEPPPGDGSAFEQGAELVKLTLGDAFAKIEEEHSGDPKALVIDDAKTEILLARLWRMIEGEG
jgi:8-oxo-dGTP pyrophosphatase MutT (NUDIX family)